MKKTDMMCGHKYKRVKKRQFENFCRFFEDKTNGYYCMDWYDVYDWSLEPDYVETNDANKQWIHSNNCMVARYLTDGSEEYYIRCDYIKLHNYDLDTVVPEEPKPQLNEKEQKMADTMCKLFDELFKREANKNGQ